MKKPTLLATLMPQSAALASPPEIICLGFKKRNEEGAYAIAARLLINDVQNVFRYPLTCLFSVSYLNIFLNHVTGGQMLKSILSWQSTLFRPEQQVSLFLLTPVALVTHGNVTIWSETEIQTSCLQMAMQRSQFTLCQMEYKPLQQKANVYRVVHLASSAIVQYFKEKTNKYRQIVNMQGRLCNKSPTTASGSNS